MTHVPGSGFSIHLISGIIGTIQAKPRLDEAKNLKGRRRLSHRARLRQRHGRKRIDEAQSPA